MKVSTDKTNETEKAKFTDKINEEKKSIEQIAGRASEWT